MPSHSAIALLVLRTAILHDLLSAQAYGIPLPVILRTAKQFGQGMLGTAGAEIPNSGFSWSLLSQFSKDTRNLHLWVASAPNQQDLIFRIVQYLALEIVGASFGHLGRGSGAIGMGGFRNLVATQLAPSIAYNASLVKKALGIEKDAIALLIYCGSEGKTQCKAVLEAIGKLRGGSQSTMLLKPALNFRQLEFHCRGQVIMNNLVQEHTSRRCLKGWAFQQHTKQYYAKVIPSTILTTSQLNTTALIGWTVFGVTVVGGSIVVALYFFQKSQRNKYYNVDETVIDITAEDFE